MKHITVLTYRYEDSDKLYTVKSEIGGHKLTEWFNIIKTKTILGKIDYAVFTKEITSWLIKF